VMPQVLHIDCLFGKRAALRDLTLHFNADIPPTPVESPVDCYELL
jgi:hypothetical protein